MASRVELGRVAFSRHAWADARALLAGEEPLDASDLECLAIAAHLVGRDEESARAWERAHLERVQLGDHERAARCVFWLSIGLLLRGEVARAGGWLARAERLTERTAGDSAARALLLVPAFLQALEGGEHEAARAAAEEMFEVGQRVGDADVLAFACLCRGEVAIAMGDTMRGVRLLDEAMVSVASGEVSPIASGIVYCAVIEACMEVFDLRRAAEWTDALHEWCASQPDLVPFRGQCMVHRSQVLQAHGAWVEAVMEAERARRQLSEPPHPALGLALYQQGELHRLRGELDAAERAYRGCNQHGLEPAPGFALLRLAEGNVDAAAAAIRRMLDESGGQLARPRILAAAVDVLLAAGDVDGARAAGEELADIAAAIDAPLLHAIADFAAGSVSLIMGDARAALAPLRRACSGWRDLEMPYDEARARVKVAVACRMLGDHDAADLELDAARSTFDRLGARPDSAGIARLLQQPAGPRHTTDLTERECEVLRLVAAGKTNREIAAALIISAHTVARHLQNIFTKLGVSSRAAATAYAYEHGLVGAGAPRGQN